MDKVRDELVTKAGGDQEIHREEAHRNSIVLAADLSTAAKRTRDAFGIQARMQRLKPSRDDIDCWFLAAC